VAGLCGLFLGLLQLGQFGLVLELCPRADATIYFGLMQSLLAPLAIAAPLLGGYLRDVASYSTVLGIALGMVVMGGILWRVGLPRPGSEWANRQMGE
jgi:MFS family permease